MRNLALAQIGGLSTRAINSCRDSGIITLGDLFDFIRFHSLTSIRNCGARTARELSQIIYRFESQVLGFQYNLFAVNYDDEPRQEVLSDSVRFLQAITTDDVMRLLNGIYDSNLATLSDGLPTKIKAIYPDAASLLYAVSSEHEVIFSYHEGWSVNDHFGFWNFCHDTFHNMLKETATPVGSPLYEELHGDIEYLDDKMTFSRCRLMRSRLSSLLAVE